jgi:hypothetical protein
VTYGGISRCNKIERLFCDSALASLTMSLHVSSQLVSEKKKHGKGIR